MGTLSKKKAQKILKDKKVHGKPLTKKQRGYMGVIASGKKKAAARKKRAKKRL